MKIRLVSLLALLIISFLVLGGHASAGPAWTQTSRADFDTGRKIDIDSHTSPGDLALERAYNYQGPPTIDAGPSHNVAVRQDGTVIAGGSNHYLETSVSAWTNIKSVAAGDRSTYGLTKDGTVAAVGWPANVSGWTNISQIAAGENRVVGLKTDGTVVGAGSNYYGEINVSGWTNISQIAVGENHVVGLKTDGTVVGAGWNGYLQLNFSGWSDIVAVAAGGYYTAGLKKDGTVVTAGYISSYAAPAWQDIVALAAGDSHLVGLKNDGTVVGVGYNYFGQINVESWRDIKAVAAGQDHTLGIKADGTAVIVGAAYGVTNVSGWTDIKLNYLPRYEKAGTWESHAFDSKNSLDFDALTWGATTPAPAGPETIKFQIATNNETTLIWDFVGPDGTAGSYYTNPGQAVWPGHDRDRYVKLKAYMSTADTSDSPVLNDVSIFYDVIPDSSAPVTTLYVNGNEGQNGWYTSGVTVYLSATDNRGSGVAGTKYSLDGVNWNDYTGEISIGEGITTIHYFSTDNAGNAEPEKTREIKVDWTPPAFTSVVINTPVALAEYLWGSIIPADWSASATDTLSGMGSITADAANGEPIDTYSAGTNSFTVTAKDQAGNKAEESVAYFVNYLNTLKIKPFEGFASGENCVEPVSTDGQVLAVEDANTSKIIYFKNKKRFDPGIKGEMPSVKDGKIVYFDENNSISIYDIAKGAVTQTGLSSPARRSRNVPSRYFNGTYVAYRDLADQHIKLYSTADGRIIDTGGVGARWNATYSYWGDPSDPVIDGGIVTFVDNGQMAYYDISTGLLRKIERGVMPVVSGDIISYVVPTDSWRAGLLKFYRISTGEIVSTGIRNVESQSVFGNQIIANTHGDSGNSDLILYDVTTRRALDTGLYACTARGGCWVDIHGDAIFYERWEGGAYLYENGNRIDIYPPADLNGDGVQAGDCVAGHAKL